MRTAKVITATAVATLVVAGCNGEPDDDATQVRVDELEDELDETREAAEDLLAENERLQEEIRILTEDDAAEPEDPDEPDADDDEEPTEEPEEPSPAQEPQPIRTAEGLNEQLRLLFEQPTGPDGAWEPGTTDWRAADPPELGEDGYDSPGQLAFDLAAALEAASLGLDTWEATTRVLLDEDDQDLAYVAVLSWGYADDSVIGRDLRMTITQDDGQWQPGGAEERFHCMRGVTDDGELCV